MIKRLPPSNVSFACAGLPPVSPGAGVAWSQSKEEVWQHHLLSSYNKPPALSHPMIGDKYAASPPTAHELPAKKAALG